MTPERIAELTSLHTGNYHPPKRGLAPKPWVPALVNRFRKRVEVRRSVARELVVVPCPKCGVGVSTNALSGIQPILCLDCSTPEALKERQAYLRQQWAELKRDTKC